MNEASPKYPQMTLRSSPNATFSLASGDGQPHLDLPVGQTQDLFGQDHPPANPSQLQETTKPKTMNAICGPSSSISLESANLQQFLGSRLQAQLGTNGSTIYKLTWKNKTTPRQWSYSQLVASALRKKETDCGLQHKGWPTPCANDNRDRGKWKDPVVQRRIKIGKSIELSMLVGVVASSIEQTGQIPHMSTALIQKREPSQLNPRFSLWLMGYPIAWAYCAERVTPLSRRSARK